MLYVIMSLYAKDTLLKVQEAIESLLNQIYTPFIYMQFVTVL